MEEEVVQGRTSMTNFASNMLAGAIAGVSEHVALFPVDTMKTRLQALGHPGQRLRGPIIPALVAVVRREGIAGLYGGVGAAAAGAGPAHAIYFATYEAARHALMGDAEGHHPFASAAAGATATLASDAVMTPLDVVKQRLQVASSPYRNSLDCIRRMLAEEGVHAFFRSYRTTVFMNVPYTAVHFATYESSKLALPFGDQEDLLVQLTSGGLAGGLAALVTTPMDVVKTRLQLEGVNTATRYTSSAIKPVLRQIIQQEGRAALWSGWRARCLFHIPSAAICWATYESTKKLLR